MIKKVEYTKNLLTWLSVPFLLLFVGGCSGEGTEELTNETLGLVLSISRGDEQVIPVSQLYPLPLEVVVSNAAREAVPTTQIEFIQLSDTDALILNPRVNVDSNGVASTQVRAPSRYNETIRIEARISGTSVRQVFTLTTPQAGGIRSIALDTQNKSIEEAGIPFYMVVYALDEVGSVIESYGTAKEPIKHKVQWTFETTASWGRQAPTLPEFADCEFINGVCTTTPDYILTDAERDTLVSAQLMGEAVEPAFEHFIELVRGPDHAIGLTDQKNGPDYYFDEGLYEWINQGALFCQSINCAEGLNYVDADVSNIEFYATILDRAGNFTRNATVDDSLSWALRDANDAEDWVELMGELFPGSDPSSQSYNPQTAIYFPEQARFKVTASGLTGNSFATFPFHVDPGFPSLLEVTPGSDMNPVAGQNNEIAIRVLDQHGNLTRSTITKPGVTVNANIQIEIQGSMSGPIVSGGPGKIGKVNDAGGSLSIHGSDNLFSGKAYVENGIVHDSFWLRFNDASNVSPSVNVSMSRDDDPFTAGFDESFSISSSITSINVTPGSLSRIEVRRDEGDPATDPLICGTDRGFGTGWRDYHGREGACHIVFTAGGSAQTYYTSVADAGGNPLFWDGTQWLMTPDDLPNIVAANEWSLAQPMVSDMSNRFNSSHMTFTPSYQGSSHLGVYYTAPDGQSVSQSFHEFVVNTGELDHYTARVLSNHPNQGGTVYADGSFAIELTMRDVAGNRLYQDVSKTLTMVSTPMPLANSPDGSTSPNLPSGSYTFQNGQVTISGIRIPNSDQNSAVTLQISDMNGIETSPIYLSVVPGALDELRIKTNPSGLLGEVLNDVNIEINTDDDLAYYVHGFDSVGNLRGGVPGTWSTLDGFGSLIWLQNTAAVNDFAFDPVKSGSGRLQVSYGGLTASTGTITIHPGEFRRLLIRKTNGSSVNAGESFSVSVEMVDDDNNVLTSQLGDPLNTVGNGLKPLTILVLNSFNTRLGYSYSAPPSGNYNFIDGVLETDHNFTLYNSSSTPTLRYELDSRLGRYPSMSGFEVVNGAPERIFMKRLTAQIYAGSEGRYDIFLEDLWGNTITEGGAENSTIQVSFDSGLDNQEIIAANGMTNVSGVGTENLQADLVQGRGDVRFTATESGVLQMRAQVPGQNYQLSKQNITVLPKPEVNSISFVPGQEPPDTYAASISSGYMQFKVQILDEYSNVIYTNNSDSIDLSLTATDNDPAVLGGTTSANLINGISSFIDVTYPRAHEIILRATHGPSGLFVEKAVQVVPNSPRSSVTLLPGQTLRQGVPSLAEAVQGAPPEQEVGVPFDIRVLSVDEAFNHVTSYGDALKTAAINFTDDPNVVTLPIGSSEFVAGEASFSVTHRKAGQQQGLVASTLLVDNDSQNYTVRPGVPTYLVPVLPGQSFNEGVTSYAAALLSAPTDQVAGTSFNVTVYLTDQFYNIIDDDNSSQVNLTFSTDPQASHSGSVPTNLAAGSADFSVTYLKAHDLAKITPIFVSGPSLTTVYDSTNFTVQPQSTPIYSIAYLPAYQTYNPGQSDFDNVITGAIPDIQAGQALSVRALAVDNFGNVVTSFNEAVSLDISDPRAIPPAASQFINGEVSFNNTEYIVADTAQTFVTQSALNNVISPSFNVVPNGVRQTLPILKNQTFAPGQYDLSDAVTGDPETPVAGEAGFYVDIYLVDEYFNQVAESPSVGVITDDPTDTDPAAQNLVGGYARYDITNFRAGDRTLTASSAYTNISSDVYQLVNNTATKTIVVMPGESLIGGFTERANALTGVPTNRKAGVDFTATVYAVDDYFNQAFDYNGPIVIQTNDPNDIEPSTPTGFSSGEANFTITNTTQGNNRQITVLSSSFATNFDSSLYQVLPNDILPGNIIALLPGQVITQGIADFSAAVSGPAFSADANQEFTVNVFLTDFYHNLLSGENGQSVALASPLDPHVIIQSASSGVISNGQTSFTVKNRRAGLHTLEPASSGFTTEASSEYTILPLEPTNLLVLLPGNSVDHGASSYGQALLGTPASQKVSSHTVDNSFQVEVMVADKFFNRVPGTFSVDLTTPEDNFDDETVYTLNSFDNSISGMNYISIDHRTASAIHYLVPTLTFGSYTGNCGDGAGECSGALSSASYTVSPETATQTIALLPGESLANPGAPDLDTAISRLNSPSFNTDSDISVRVIAVDDFFNINPQVGGSTSFDISIVTDANSPLGGGQFAAGETTVDLTPVTPNTNHQIQVSNAATIEGGPWTHRTSTPFEITYGTPEHIITQLPGQTFNESRMTKAQALVGQANVQSAGQNFSVSFYLTDKRFNIVPTSQNLIVSAHNDSYASFAATASLASGQLTTFNFENRLAHPTDQKRIDVTVDGGLLDTQVFQSSDYLVEPGPGARLVPFVASQQSHHPGESTFSSAIKMLSGTEVTTVAGSGGFNAQVLYTDQYFNILWDFDQASTIELGMPLEAQSGPTGAYDLVSGETVSLPNITHIKAGTFQATPSWPSSPPVGLTIHNLNYTVSPAAMSQSLVLFSDQILIEGVNAIGEAVSGPTSAKTAGQSYDITVYALDNYFNIVESENGNFTLNSSDHSAGLQGGIGGAFNNGVSLLSNKVTPIRATTGTPWEIQALIDGFPMGTSNITTYDVNPGAADQLLVLPSGQSLVPGQLTRNDAVVGTPTENVAGYSQTVTVYLTDAYFNIVDTSNDAVSLSLTGGGLGVYADPIGAVTGTPPTQLTSGVANFSVDLRSVGARRVEGAVGAFIGQSDDISVVAGDAVQSLTILPGETHVESVTQMSEALTGVPDTQSAGTGFTATVKAVDAYFNTVSDYTGSVSVTTSDPGDTDPVSPTQFSGGTADFNITNVSTGVGQTLQASTGLSSDPVSSAYEVVAGAASQLIVLLPGQTHNEGVATLNEAITGAALPQTAGEDFTVTVKAVDSYFNVAADSSTTVTLTTNDVNDTDPSPGVLSSGTYSFTVNNRTAGSGHNMNATGGGYASNVSSDYTVNPGAATQIIAVLPGQTHIPGQSSFATAVTGTPSDQVAGTSFSVEVMGVDAYFNRVTSDDTTSVSLSTSDPNDTEPGSQTLTQGYALFDVTNIQAGSGLSVTPSGSGYGSVVSSDYVVNADSASQLIVLLPGQTHNEGVATLNEAITGAPAAQEAGGAFSFSVIAVDSYFNKVTSYNQSPYLRFTINGANPAVAPPNLAPSSPSNGIYAFSTGTKVFTNGLTFYNASDAPSLSVQECLDGGACASLGLAATSDNLSLNPNATLSYVLIRDSSDGGGDEVSAFTYSTLDADPSFYAAGYDVYGNFKSDTTVTWQATRTTGGDLDSHLSALSSSSTILDLSQAGAGDLTITATPSTGSADSTGLITLLEQGASHFVVELDSAGPKTVGESFALTVTAKKADNTNAVDYSGSKTITWSTTAGSGASTCGAGDLNPELPPLSLSFSGGVATTSSSVLLKMVETGVTISAEDSTGTLLGVSDAFDVAAGTLNCIVFRDQANGVGAVIGDQTLAIDSSLSVYAGGYDLYGNFIADQSVTWTGSGALEHLPYPSTGTATRIVAVQAGVGALIADGATSINVTVNPGDTNWTSSTTDSEGNQLLSSSNVVDIFHWDVVGDGSSSWRTSGTQSWATESGSATRGSRSEFPARVHIIATSSGLDIIDATTNDLFIRFNLGSGLGLDSNYGSIQTVKALNGKVYVGLRDGSSDGSLVILDFAGDEIYRIDDVGSFIWSHDISNRNTTGTWTSDVSYPVLNDKLIHDVAVSNVGGEDYVAIASTGGVQLLKASGTTSLYQDSTTGSVLAAKIDSSGKLYYTEEGQGLHRADLTLPLSSNFAPTRTYSRTTNAEVPSLTFNNILIAEGTSTADAGENTILTATPRGLAVINEHSTMSSSTSITYTSTGSGSTVFGGSAYFDGISGYASAADKAARPINQGTIEFWFRSDNSLNSGSSGFVLFEKGDGDKTVDENYGVEFDGSTGKLVFYVVEGGVEQVVTSTATSWTKGQWYHIAATFDGSNGLGLWIDGVYQGGNAVDVSGWSGNTGNMNWGARGSTSMFFSGGIDEFRMTDDVRYIGTGSISVPSAAFTSDANTSYLYHFDESSGFALSDSAGSPEAASLFGQSWLATPMFDGDYTEVIAADVSVSASRVDLELTTIDSSSSLQSAEDPSSTTLSDFDSSLGDTKIEIFHDNGPGSYDLIYGTSGSGIFLHRK